MYVYAIGAMLSENGIPTSIESVKIGITNMPDPRGRVGVLQIGNHRHLKLLYAIKVTDRASARKLEKSFHKRLMPAHEMGEWFSMSHQRTYDLVMEELPVHINLAFSWMRDDT
jgi:hypothetical protein